MNVDSVLKEALKGTPLEGTHRVEMFVDGKFFVGITTKLNPREGQRQMLEFLKELVATMESPSVDCTGEDL